MADPAARSERRGIFALLLITALLWFSPLNAPVLFHPDEGRYAEIPREMVASGDWVTPRLDAIKYFEKPPLQYWATAAAFELFGQHAWTVRLWPAFSGFLGVLLTAWLARRVFNTRVALMAAAVQAGSLLYIGLARLAVLDMSLSFSLQLAMTALVLLVHRSPPEKGRWHAPLLLGLGLALAMLSKGLVGILIPCAVGGIYLSLYRDWGLPLRAQPWWSLLALALIAAPWFLLVSVRNPEFAHFFFIHEHFERFLTRVHQRYEPDWFFVPVLLLGFLPWTGLLPRTFRDAWRASRNGDAASAMLLIWAVFIFVFFSVSQSKLIPYIVPLFPAMALLTGRTLSQLSAARLAAQISSVGIGAVLLTAVILLLWKLPATAALVASSGAPVVLGLAAAFLALALGMAVAAALNRRGRFEAAVAAMALGALALVQIAMFAGSALPQMRAITEFRQTAQPLLTASTVLYCVDDYWQPIPFYLQRPCTLVGYRGEFDFGLQQEPARWLADLPQFAARWTAATDAMALVSPQAFGQLQTLGVPMRVIYTSPSLVAMVRQ